MAKKYGAMFVLLPLSDKGLPESLNEKIEINNSNASMYLESKYNQLLVDGDIEWTTEFATRLYETFNKLLEAGLILGSVELEDGSMLIDNDGNSIIF